MNSYKPYHGQAWIARKKIRLAAEGLWAMLIS
jgi:hypothetical protein